MWGRVRCSAISELFPARCDILRLGLGLRYTLYGKLRVEKLILVLSRLTF